MRYQVLINRLHMVVDGLFESVPILLSFVVLGYSLSEKEAGFIISASNVVNACIGLFSGTLVLRFGFVRTLGLTLIAYGIGYLFCAVSPNIYLIGLCLIVANSGSKVFHNAANSYLAANSDKAAMGRVLGDFAAIGDIGRIVLVTFAGFAAPFSVFQYPGWRGVCAIYGFGAAALTMYLLFAADDDGPPRAHTKPASLRQHLPNFSVIRASRPALLIAGNMLDAFGSNQIFVFLPFLVFSKGIDPKILGGFALTFSLGCFVGKAALGRLVDRCGSRRVFIGSELVMAALIAALLLSQQVGVIMIAALCLGIVTKGTSPVAQAIIVESTRDRSEYQDIISINTFLRGVSNMIAPILFGLVASSAGIEWSFVMMAVSVLCATVPVLATGRSDELVAWRK